MLIGIQRAITNVFRSVAHRGGFAAESIFKIANLYVQTYKNHNHDSATNGEFLILDRLRILDIRTVFDVGANAGYYTLACLQRFGDAHIHAFEPVPATAQKLASNLGGRKNITINPFGLADSAGLLDIHYNPDPALDGLSSLVGTTVHAFLPGWVKTSVDFQTGDAYCLERGVTSIDLLKIDVEGAEDRVLRGFERMFNAEAISAVQFEFGMCNIDTKFLLKDFWRFFKDRGFVIGAVMPRGVRFKEYDYWDEDFRGPTNFLATHRSRPDYVRILKCPR